MDRNKEQNLNLEGISDISEWLENFIKQLTERLEKMEETLVIDRIEGNTAVCEIRKNGKMKNIPIKELPEGVKEGNILKWEDGKYVIDNSNEIEKRIEEKMKNVWE